MANTDPSMEATAALMQTGRVGDRVRAMARCGAIGRDELDAAEWLERTLTTSIADGLVSRSDRTKDEQMTSPSSVASATTVGRRQLLAQWQRRLEAAGIDGSAVLAVVLGGIAPSRIDRSWRRRNGWCRQQVVCALQLLATLRRQNSHIDTRGKNKYQNGTNTI